MWREEKVTRQQFVTARDLRAALDALPEEYLDLPVRSGLDDATEEPFVLRVMLHTRRPDPEDYVEIGPD